jgi:hypothetical protein
MATRKSFLKTLVLSGLVPLRKFSFSQSKVKADGPVVISTWRHGLEANKGAWKILNSGGSPKRYPVHIPVWYAVGGLITQIPIFNGKVFLINQ